MSENCVLMVTGASSDVGIELINKISENYSLIIGLYSHMNDKLLKLSSDLGDKMLLLQADFLDESSINSVIDELKERNITVSHFVHLASDKVRALPFRKCSWDEVQRGIDISLKSVYLILQNVLHGMVKAKSGKVIFMLTSNVLDMPARNQTAYVISKYSLLGLFKSLDAEYRERGIVFSAVSPDMIDTRFLSELPELVVEQSRKASKGGRNLQVSDIVPVFEMILSQEDDKFAGENIPVLNM